jgi:DNA-binding response OmpR family regulator
MPAPPQILYLPGEQTVWVVRDADHHPGEPAQRPTLDDDGLLRFGGRWVAIPDTQLALAALLVRNLGRLVRSTDVRRAYEGAGGSGSETSVRSAVSRLRRRTAEVGLHLRVVRDRGLVLDVAWAS